MFDLGWSELLLIGIVALIVVGPKDLPVLFRNVGRFIGKAKGMAREFTNAMNEAADESGLRDVSKSLKTATNPLGSALDELKGAARDMTRGFDGQADDAPPITPRNKAPEDKVERMPAAAEPDTGAATDTSSAPKASAPGGVAENLPTAMPAETDGTEQAGRHEPGGRD
ncbi:Sec-independent protein translocase protein TatB [Pontibaca methylaminivorans]|uniref:Sec-independent protein translocase protein TatB n=1 Tax=Pontibaca methylaminivorans TaxID=515897 RepID=A0A1R3WE69_9RHOB|nr:Sec-independent protein translocase protein TatB [Pontibaca methylaminivorans]SIT76380.1 sec-independent protein translocase protein TatB [Pontibaca methylaminivorans]